MLVVNLYGGPSIGKSTLAPDVFRLLKRAGIETEIPPEVAKIRAQRNDTVFLGDQLAVFGETQHQLNMARRSGALVAVVDSPILLSLIYQPADYLKSFPALVREVHDQFTSLNYVLRRDPVRAYSNVGRVHTEPEAIKIDTQIVNMLEEQGVNYRLVDSSEFSAQCIFQDTLKALGMAAKPKGVAMAPKLKMA